MQNWDTAIATVSVAGELEDRLRAISAAGFTGYELFEADLISSHLSPEELKQLSADLNIIPYLYQPFHNFESVIEPIFAQNLERARHKFALMNRLGIDLLLLCSNVATATDYSDSLIIDQLGRMGDLAKEFNIKVAYEALAWSRVVSTYDHAWKVVKELNHDQIGICLDTFHIYGRNSELDTIDEIDGNKIFFIQLADAQSTTLDLLSWSRHHRLFPGEGEWNLKPFMQKVLQAGYTGPMSLEVFNDTFRQRDPLATAMEAKRSLILLQQQTEQDDAVSEQTHIANQPESFSYIELQTSAPEQAKAVLKQLGFQSTMVHRSRWTQVWRNGDINIVLRADSRGTSGAFSLVGFGIDISDHANVLQRAENFQSGRAPLSEFFDSFSLEGLTAPGGEHIFLTNDELLSQMWQQEFISNTEGESGVSNVSYLKVDHIAIVQPWEQLEESRVYYRNVLGLETSTNQFLPDSFGLVKSVSMNNGDKEFRLALNALPNRYYFGDVTAPRAAHHIAFLSDDLIGDLAILRSNGLELLEIPENYYEDLEARFDFDASLMAELRRNHVLYDRDADGGFLHAYTPLYGSVFFEIVERVDHYDGYGAPNAAVRMAANRRYLHRQRIDSEK